MSEHHDVESLREIVRRGGRPEYLFFWGHTARGTVISKECLSQWYPARFEVDGCVFPTAEHYMMYHKARLFGDEDTAERLLDTPTPRDAKALGRRVKQFDEAMWNEHRFAIVVNGNLAKFSQTPSL